ncbi:MAG: tetratricopeptide repeat protein, partial [Candidatus Thermoplasmatota archaeon]|nr:tetratricopeptide repeat protein [Candidatus Thermoplasmatota archaeon]
VSIPQDRSYSEIIAHSFMGLGYTYWRMADYPRSLEMFSKSLQYAKIENDLNTIGTLYINIGNVFNHRGDIKKALDYYNRGIKHLETTSNVIGASVGYSNIGGIYLQTGDIGEAEKALELAFDKASEKGRHDYWWPIINFIELRGRQNRFSEASSIFDTCEEAMKDRDDKVGLGIAYLSIGKVRALDQRFEESETMILRSITMLEGLGMLYELGMAKHSLGEVYILSSRYEEAKGYLDEAYQIFKNIGARFQAEKVRDRLLEMRENGGFI